MVADGMVCPLVVTGLEEERISSIVTHVVTA